MSIHTRGTLLAVAICLACPGLAPAAERTEVRIVPEGSPREDAFGYAVELDGDTLVVGDPYDDETDTNIGAVHVYVRAGAAWEEQARLDPSDGAPNDLFGISVALDGDTLVVGARLDDDKGFGSGSAYVFTRSGTDWTEQDKLTATDGAANDDFGIAVAVSGDTAVVGSRFDADDGTYSGSAYVFERSGATWEQKRKLTASDAETYEFFGGAVSVEGDTIAVGASADVSSKTGSVYVYRRSGDDWVEEAKLVPAGGRVGEMFGRSLALSNGSLAVGAPTDDTFGSGFDTGSVHVFRRSGGAWDPEQVIAGGCDSDVGDLFGTSVCLAGDRLAVGAPGDRDVGARTGAAYVFSRSGSAWTETSKDTAGDASAGDEFGWTVAIESDALAVGAPQNLREGDGSTSAYVFEGEGRSSCGSAPPPGTIRAFLLPKAIRVKAEGKRPRAKGKLVFDTGPADVDFTAPAELRIGSRTVEIPGFEAVKSGKAYRYKADGVSLKLKPSRHGSSKASLVLKVDGGGIETEGALTLRYAGGGVDAEGTVLVSAGKYRFGRKRGTLVAPDLALLKAKAKLSEKGHAFKFVAGFATDGGPAPATAPDCRIGFGDAFEAMAPGDGFTVRGERHILRGTVPGLRGIVIDHAKERVAAKAVGVDLGAVEEGPVPLLVLFAREDDVRAVLVRAIRRGRTLKY